MLNLGDVPMRCEKAAEVEKHYVYNLILLQNTFGIFFHVTCKKYALTRTNIFGLQKKRDYAVIDFGVVICLKIAGRFSSKSIFIFVIISFSEFVPNENKLIKRFKR